MRGSIRPKDTFASASAASARGLAAAQAHQRLAGRKAELQNELELTFGVDGGPKNSSCRSDAMPLRLPLTTYY